MTRRAEIEDLFATTDLSFREIAEKVGCSYSYVRTVQQRMLHPERDTERWRVYYNRRYETDEQFREKRKAYQRARYKRMADTWKMHDARSRGNQSGR